VAGTVPPRARAHGRALPHTVRQTPSRLRVGRDAAREAGRGPAAVAVARSAQTEPPHHRAVLGGRFGERAERDGGSRRFKIRAEGVPRRLRAPPRRLHGPCADGTIGKTVWG